MRGAFTLIELMMALAIAALLAAAAYPLLGGAGEIPFEAAVNTVKTDIERTRAGAMARASTRAVIFTAGSGEYVYGAGEDGAGHARDLGALRGGAAAAESAVIAFNSLGEPSGAESITLARGGVKARLVIEPFTGRVSIGEAGR